MLLLFTLYETFILLVRHCGCLNLVVIKDSGNSVFSDAAKFGLEEAETSGPHTLTVVSAESTDFLKEICEVDFANIDGMLDVSKVVVGSEDLARYFNVPLVTMKEWNHYSFDDISKGNVLTSVRASSSDYMKSVVTFVNSLNASRESVLILFSSSFDHNMLFPSLNTESFVPVYMKEVNATNGDEVIDFIKKLRVSEIILGAELSLVEDIVKKAVEARMLNGIYHWYVLTLDLHNFQCSECGQGSFILFQKTYDQKLYDKLMKKFSDFQKSSKAVDLVYAYETGKIFGSIYKMAKSQGKWLEPSSTFKCWNTATAIANSPRYMLGNEFIKKINIAGVLGPINFNNTLQNQYSEILITEFKVDTNKPYYVAKWSTTSGLGKYNISLDLLTRRHLKILVIPEPPFVIKLSNGTFQGYSIDIVAKLSEGMNFDYSFHEQLDSKYGAVLENGTFTGLIGSIARKEYDMGVGAVTITSERERVVDFSIPYYDYAAIQILMKKVTASTKGDQAFFLKAFTWDVWATVIATIIGTGFLICFVDRVSPFSFQNRLKTDEIREGEADGKIFSIKESMWFVLGAYTQAGESFDPRSISCRVIVVGLWLFAYLMMAMYTANLSAQLTVAKLTSRPSSLEELALQQKVKYSTLSNTSMHDYFFRMMKAEEDIFQFWTEKGINNLDKPKEAALMSTWKYPIEERYTNIYNRMKAWGFTNSMNETLKKIKNDDWAFFLETPIIKYHTLKDCDVIAVGEPFSQRPYGIVLQNNSPLLNDLNLRILILQRDRILEQLKVKWWNSGNTVCSIEDNSAGLGLDTLGGAFAFLAVGIGIAGLIFIGEKIVAKIWGTEWAKAAGNDPTVVRPMGMMSTVNVNLGSHIEIRRSSHISNPNASFRKQTLPSNRLSIHGGSGTASVNQPAGELSNGNANQKIPNNTNNANNTGNNNPAFEPDSNH